MLKKLFNKLVSNVVGGLLIRIGFVEKAKKKIKNRNVITSLYFHNLGKSMFENCIIWLLNNGYYFLSVKDLENILLNKNKITQGGVCITIDDGNIENLESIIPIVEKYHIPVTIFIPTEPVENGNYWWTYIKLSKKYDIEIMKTLENKKKDKIVKNLSRSIKPDREVMSIADIQRISKSALITIGGHTVTHPITPRCSEEELEFELGESKLKLEAWINKNIEYFAYPNGSFDGREKKYLIKNGYKLAFTTEPKLIDPALYDQYLLPRYCLINRSLNENICRMTGVWQSIF